MMELLLSYSPDLEVKIHLMRLTPLHVAVTVRHFSSASLLLEAGADVEAQTDCGERPLHIAIKQNDARMVRVRAVRIFSAVVVCPSSQACADCMCMLTAPPNFNFATQCSRF